MGLKVEILLSKSPKCRVTGNVLKPWVITFFPKEKIKDKEYKNPYEHLFLEGEETKPGKTEGTEAGVPIRDASSL